MRPRSAAGAVLICTVMLTLGTTLTYPFEMDTIVTLSGGRLVATHYGLYNTIAGIAIAAGNLLTGLLVDRAAPALPPGSCCQPWEADARWPSTY